MVGMHHMVGNRLGMVDNRLGEDLVPLNLVVLEDPGAPWKQRFQSVWQVKLDSYRLLRLKLASSLLITPAAVESL